MNRSAFSDSPREQSKRFKLAILLAAVAGLSYKSTGVLYAADLLVISAFIGMLVRFSWLNWARPMRWTVALLFALSLVYFGLDLANGITAADYLRGIARNATYAASVGVAFSAYTSFGLRRFLVLILVFSLSVGLLILLGVSSDWNSWDKNLTTFTKFNYGLFAAPATILILGRTHRSAFFVTLATAVCLAVVADFRAGAAIILLSALLIIVWRRSRDVSTISLALKTSGILVLAATVVPLATSTAIFGDDVVDRRLQSNRQRLDMIVFSLGEIEQRPLTGYGSWQNIERYTDAENPYTRISVHSAIIQYLYEYGAIGLLFPGVTLIAAFWAFPGLIRVAREEEFRYAIVAVFYFILGVYNIFMGGIGGYGRFIFAGSTALSVAFASEAITDTRNEFLRPPPPFRPTW